MSLARSGRARRCRPFAPVACLVLSIAQPLPAYGQIEDRWSIRQLTFENDNVFPTLYDEPSDRFFTQGIRVGFGQRSFDANDAPDDMPIWSRIAARRCRSCSVFPTFSFGHEVYTPELIESPDAQPGEHPWAAWLYGELAAIVDTPKGSRHEYRLRLGVTGDPAKGEELQNFWHRLINRPTSQGWSHQLGDDVGVNAYYRYQRTWLTSKEGSRVNWDVLPHFETAIGTMHTHASIGGTVRIGPGIEGLMYSPVERPVEGPVWPRNWQEIDIYGFFGASLIAVGHNYFLEGSRFHDDLNTVEREDLVREFVFGAAARYRGWELIYSVTHRSEQFVRLIGDDDAKHSYGSLTISRGIR